MLIDGERLIPKNRGDNLGKGRRVLQGTAIPIKHLRVPKAALGIHLDNSKLLYFFVFSWFWGFFFPPTWC